MARPISITISSFTATISKLSRRCSRATARRVDRIYIDPPYNTGTEGWCYNDAVNAPLMREWLKKAANPVERDDLQRHDNGSA